MTKTAMQAALERSGANSPRYRLYVLAANHLSKAGLDVGRALPRFIDAVTAGADLIVALVDRETVEATARDYLQAVLRDMKGGAPDRPRSVPRPANADPSSEAVRAWSSNDIGEAKRPALGYTRDYLRGTRDNPLYKPESTPISPETLLRTMTRVARSVLDDLLVDGRPVGDVTAAAALAWAEGRGRQARLVYVLAHGLPPNAIIRDHVTPEKAEEIKKRLESEAFVW